ncbi:MAG TPA: hypothetical protein VMF89_12045 [Polyangiales bacterium]|nr:hypothetical protein [Polyangiales bacterium]
MKRRLNTSRAAQWLLTLLASACASPLAPHDYRGEVVFRAEGVVESPSRNETWNELQPALAYLSEWQLRLDDSIHVRPLDASGISGSFQIELFDTPPEDALIEFETHPDWGRIAPALIVAVTKEHPSRVDRRRSDVWNHGVCQVDAECACEVGETVREIDYTYGTASPAHYHEVLCCPDADSDDEACKLASAEGDARVKDQPALPVAAVVQDVFLFYIERAAPAGSEMARYLFDSTEFGLDAGYHLVRVTKRAQSSEFMQELEYEVIETDDAQLIFQQDVVPWGVNL